MTPPVVLVMAKVPVAGRVKTRLASAVGDRTAARLALAALLDTLDVCEEVFGVERCHLALAGDLGELDVDTRRKLHERLRGWTVMPQRGGSFAERLERAHVDVHAVARVPVVQVGTDSPHVAPPVLADVAVLASAGRRVLGPARDGGWWVLASATAADVAGLGRVPMSTDRTGQLTGDLLRAQGLDVVLAPEVSDVDDAADAEAAAREAPGTRFAGAWRELAHPASGRSRR